MAGDTNIEWATKVWNPLVGCSVISPGCTHCYAMKMAARIEAMAAGRGQTSSYDGLTRKTKAGAVWTGEMRLVEDALLLPLRWKKPERIFVNSMSDLFHEDVPDDWIDQVFAVIALSPQHTFQVLTKRPARMRAYVTDAAVVRRIYDIACDLGVALNPGVILIPPGVDARLAPPGPRVYLGTWPLPNVWLGVSAEDQARLNERLPELMATPAAVRFLSGEPLLGGINAAEWLDSWCSGCRKPLIGGGHFAGRRCGTCETVTSRLDWVIVGGESGPGARPMHPDWARQLRDQCAAAGVPFFFKQWGAHAWAERIEGDPSTLTAYRAGKRAAGRLLDGVEHNAMPPAGPRPSDQGNG